MCSISNAEMYLDGFPIHTHLCCQKGNDIGMKRFGGKCVKTLKIHWRANNVGVFGNTEKLSKIRMLQKYV
jgi:hypothetical protein